MLKYCRSTKYHFFRSEGNLIVAGNLSLISRSKDLRFDGDITQGAKSLYLAKKRLEVTSPAIVVLNAFLDSSDLPKEGLSGLLWNFFLA